MYATGFLKTEDEGYIYLASPYSTSDTELLNERVGKVTNVAAVITREGFVVYSPIVHSHQLAVNSGIELPGHWQFWKNIDLTMLKASRLMLVLCLEGWKESIGIAAEVEAAKEMGVEVRYVGLEAFTD